MTILTHENIFDQSIIEMLHPEIHMLKIKINLFKTICYFVISAQTYYDYRVSTL